MVEAGTQDWDFQALLNQPPGNRDKITNWEEFTRFVEVKVDKTQLEMPKLWTGEISDLTISRALKKNWFTPKKNLWLSGLKQISSPNRASNLLYMQQIRHGWLVANPQIYKRLGSHKYVVAAGSCQLKSQLFSS